MASKQTIGKKKPIKKPISKTTANKTTTSKKAATKPKVTKSSKSKAPSIPPKRQPLKKGSFLSSINFDMIPKGIEYRHTKTGTIFSKGSLKCALIGKRLMLEKQINNLPKSFTKVDIEEAKKSHMGKTRIKGKVESQEELFKILKTYFS